MTVAASSLADWLTRLENLNIHHIELGLARVAKVRAAMQLTPTCPVITLAGTNGKGSTAAFLSAILRAAGYTVGTYTSPHLLHYNERVCINLTPASDTQLLAGFEAIEAARGDTPLTYFEFSTLAAVYTFQAAQVDVMILEVGLGGRLDAVNVFDADCALVTPIDLDHQDWLGDTREAIGFEKAGIYRAGRPALCADPQPPQSLIDHAHALGAPLTLIGRDFGFTRTEGAPQWQFWHGSRRRSALPMPALRGTYQLANASAALAVLDALAARLPVDMGAIRQGLVQVEWAGRFQVLAGRPVVVLDVGHNPHAARGLAANLGLLGFAEQRYAVFSMLADKDCAAVIAALKPHIDTWLIAPLSGPRATPVAELAAALAAEGIVDVRGFDNVGAAWQAASSLAGENDRITVFGSFQTVAAVMQARHPPVKP